MQRLCIQYHPMASSSSVQVVLDESLTDKQVDEALEVLPEHLASLAKLLLIFADSEDREGTCWAYRQ